MQLDSVLRTEDWILGAMLFIGFLLLALAKRLEPRVLGITIQTLFTLGTPNSLQKFEVRFNSTGFILLGFLFVINLWVCSILFFQNIQLLNDVVPFDFFTAEFSGLQLAGICLLIIFSLIVYNFFGLFVTSWITGEWNLMRTFITQTWVNLLFFGIVFFALGLVWLLNPSVSNELFYVFIYVFLAFLMFRFFKGLIASLLERVSWYYIILYLCTLELLPLVILYGYLG